MDPHQTRLVRLLENGCEDREILVEAILSVVQTTERKEPAVTHPTQPQNLLVGGSVVSSSACVVPSNFQDVSGENVPPLQQLHGLQPAPSAPLSAPPDNVMLSPMHNRLAGEHPMKGPLEFAVVIISPNVTIIQQKTAELLTAAASSASAGGSEEQPGPVSTRVTSPPKDMTPLEIAVLSQNILAVELLLRNGAQPDFVSGLSCTCLCKVCYSFPGNIPMLRLLLESGANPDATTNNDTNSASCLIISVVKDNVEAVRALLEYGADVGYEWKGANALSMALDFKKLDIVELLEKHEYRRAQDNRWRRFMDRKQLEESRRVQKTALKLQSQLEHERQRMLRRNHGNDPMLASSSVPTGVGMTPPNVAVQAPTGQLQPPPPSTTGAPLDYSVSSAAAASLQRYTEATKQQLSVVGGTNTGRSPQSQSFPASSVVGVVGPNVTGPVLQLPMEDDDDEIVRVRDEVSGQEILLSRKRMMDMNSSGNNNHSSSSSLAPGAQYNYPLNSGPLLGHPNNTNNALAPQTGGAPPAVGYEQSPAFSGNVQQQLPSGPLPFALGGQPMDALSLVNNNNSSAMNPGAAQTPPRAYLSDPLLQKTGVTTSLLNSMCEMDWILQPKDVELLTPISSGAHGEVFLAKLLTTDEKVAVKKFPCNDKKSRDCFAQETLMLSRFRHENIVMFKGAVVCAEMCAIVSELCVESLLSRLENGEPIVWGTRVRWARDIAKALTYLHTRTPPIVHRDLKSLNILLDHNNVAKLCDFGMARTREHTYIATQHIAGSPSWMAPEVLRGDDFNDKSDVYAFGVILWELLTRKIPWPDKTMAQLVGLVGFAGHRLEIPKPTGYMEVNASLALGQTLAQIQNAEKQMFNLYSNPVEGCPIGFPELIQICWNNVPEQRPSFRSIRLWLDDILCGKIPNFSCHVVDGGSSSSSAMLSGGTAFGAAQGSTASSVPHYSKISGRDVD